MKRRTINVRDAYDVQIAVNDVGFTLSFLGVSKTGKRPLRVVAKLHDWTVPYIVKGLRTVVDHRTDAAKNFEFRFDKATRRPVERP